MEIAFDTTESEIEKQQLKFTLEAEKTITECIGILYRENGVSTAIIEVLRKLGNFLSAERTYIIYIKDELMYNDYEWCAENIISQKNTLQGIPLAMIDRWIPYFKNDKCVIFEKLEEIKEISLEEYEILDSQSITSLV